MASINADAHIQKRPYNRKVRGVAEPTPSRSSKMLSPQAIQKALQQRCSDSHSCIDQFSEKDVLSVRK